MPADWYLQELGQVLGPYTPSDLRQMAQRGRVSLDDLLRKGVIGKWIVASKVKGLFDDKRQRPQPLSLLPDVSDLPAWNREAAVENESPPITAPRRMFADAGDRLESPHQHPSPAPPPGSGISAYFGALLLLGGILSMLHFMAMDTSVAVKPVEFMGQRIGGGRVHNIGLIQERQNGVIASIAVGALGFGLIVLGRKRQVN